MCIFEDNLCNVRLQPYLMFLNQAQTKRCRGNVCRDAHMTSTSKVDDARSTYEVAVWTLRWTAHGRTPWRTVKRFVCSSLKIYFVLVVLVLSCHVMKYPESDVNVIFSPGVVRYPCWCVEMFTQSMDGRYANTDLTNLIKNTTCKQKSGGENKRQDQQPSRYWTTLLKADNLSFCPVAAVDWKSQYWTGSTILSAKYDFIIQQIFQLEITTSWILNMIDQSVFSLEELWLRFKIVQFKTNWLE